MASLSLMLKAWMMIATAMAADWQANPDDCGKTYEGLNSMIVGGEAAEEYAWPWQVAMFKNGNFVRCGGSLIDPWWVMTAAHCVDRCYLCNPEAYEFRIGTSSLTKDTDVTQQLRVSRIFAHPDFDYENYYTYDNDIALFKMKEPFTLTDDNRVNTVCLPTSDMDDEFVVGQDAVVTGWGTLVWDGQEDYPDVLNEIGVNIYNDTECAEIVGDITENMICAGLKEVGGDACNGDSGGPLVAYPKNNTDQYYQIGVVSWGLGCGVPNEPDVYAKVTRYEAWIRSFLNTTTQESYVPCVCREEEEEVEEEKLSSSIVAAISVLSVLLAIFIGISFGLAFCLHRQGKKETQEK